MNKKVKIKVIKKGERKMTKTPVVTNQPPEPNNASKLASTVADWISEFQHRRRGEAESALERFNS